MSNKKIEEELVEVLSSYDKQILIETLKNILVKLEINSSVGLSGVAIFSDLKIKKTKKK